MSTTTLADAPVGKRVRIHELLSAPELSQRLRELGFCENAIVRCMVNNEGNLICQVCDSRIGLTRKVADDIVVSSLL